MNYTTGKESQEGGKKKINKFMIKIETMNDQPINFLITFTNPNIFQKNVYTYIYMFMCRKLDRSKMNSMLWISFSMFLFAMEYCTHHTKCLNV